MLFEQRFKVILTKKVGWNKTVKKIIFYLLIMRADSTMLKKH